MARLSKNETMVYNMWITERVSVKAIAFRLKKTPNYVYHVLHDLREKGAITRDSEDGKKEGGGYLSKSRKVLNNSSKIAKENLKKGSLSNMRLHAQQWKVRILDASHAYRARLKSDGNVCPDLFGNYVVLYERFIEVYSRQNFYGVDADDSARKASEYWLGWARRVEHRLGITLIKNQYQNWRLVKSGEYADEGSAVAASWISAGEKLAVRDPADGKIFYWVDWSGLHKGLPPEDETLHPVTSKLDRERIDAFYVDLAHKDSPMLSELGTGLIHVNRMLVQQTRMSLETKDEVLCLSKELRTLIQLLGGRASPQGEPSPAPVDQKSDKKPDYFG